ncbi:NDR1/HIN1-like protein 10 [Vicia villosa]|uniref:NDR1/HIN1-like protein 10 n=1 Tax=Vicia villosa TaxID=3911 RepID=UPI00273AFAD0|nr:NDR1/HIN1-like protein 10 [Vicia villosa]
MDFDEDLGCCACCGCLCCCLFNGICNLICTLIVILGVFVFLFWLIVHPIPLKFSVTDASLTQFSFTNNNTLNYNLTLNITIRNPNRMLGIYYDNIETDAFFQGVRFSSQTLGAFFQHRKYTSFLKPVFNGRQLVPLRSDQISEFKKERKDGVYRIDVKVLLDVRFKLGLFKIGNVEPRVRCDLKVPMKTGNRTLLMNGFQATDCDWDYKWR